MRLQVLPLQSEERLTYDLLICAVGYESRAVHVATVRDARARAVFPYIDASSAALVRNMKIANSWKNATFQKNTSLREFQQSVAKLLAGVSDSQTIAIDISSFDRRRLGGLLDAVKARGREVRKLRVDLLYAPASYSPPAEHLQNSPLEAGPVSEEFLGHLRRTSLPLAAIFGLGYEPQRAIGGFELLEPSKAWAMLPESADTNYSDSLAAANRLLLSIFPTENVLSYPVLDPGETYYRLESLVASLTSHNRVVLVPMGPKIFAACCLLLGLDDAVERPAVWRIGIAGSPVPVDVTAHGEIVGLRVEAGLEPVFVRSDYH